MAPLRNELDIRPLSGALGAEIDGVDLNAIDASDLEDWLRPALNEHLVLMFHGQSLDAQRLLALGQRFGALVRHPNLIAEGPHPEVITVRREPGDEAHIGAEWHTDTTCLERPPMGAVLYAVEIPPVGGDTVFANQYLAYEALSPGLRSQLDRMRAVHNDTRVAGPRAGLNAKRSVKNREGEDWCRTETVHPVVRTHPETGRRALFVNIAYTRRFEGMTEAESEPLLGYLFEHATRPEFTCRLRWRTGSVAIWDNRCLTHIAINDCRAYRRLMLRVQIEGERPFLA